MVTEYKDIAKTLQEGFANKDFPTPPHEFKRGEIVQVSDRAFDGDEKNSIRFKSRPAIVIQNDAGNQYSANLIVCYLSGQIKKESLPTHILIEDAGCVSNCMIMAENIQTIKKEFVRPIGFLDRELMEKLNHSLVVSIGLQQYIRERTNREVDKAVARVLEVQPSHTYHNQPAEIKKDSENSSPHKGLLNVSCLKGKHVSYHIHAGQVSITPTIEGQGFSVGSKEEVQRFIKELEEVSAYL